MFGFSLIDIPQSVSPGLAILPLGSPVTPSIEAILSLSMGFHNKRLGIWIPTSCCTANAWVCNHRGGFMAWQVLRGDLEREEVITGVATMRGK